MSKLMTHNTDELILDGKLDQSQLKIGTGSGNTVGLYFDIGTTNKPGIRYAKNTQDGTSRWEYSTDGNTWYKIGKGSSSAMVPIAFSSSDLVNGKLTITHNFNNKYVLGLGYTITPKGIDYQNNAVVLDYSDRSVDSISGVVWFYGSKPTMLG